MPTIHAIQKIDIYHQEKISLHEILSLKGSHYQVLHYAQIARIMHARVRVEKAVDPERKGKTLMGIQAEGIAYGKQRKPGII